MKSNEDELERCDEVEDEGEEEMRGRGREARERLITGEREKERKGRRSILMAQARLSSFSLVSFDTSFAVVIFRCQVVFFAILSEQRRQANNPDKGTK